MSVLVRLAVKIAKLNDLPHFIKAIAVQGPHQLFQSLGSTILQGNVPIFVIYLPLASACCTLLL